LRTRARGRLSRPVARLVRILIDEVDAAMLAHQAPDHRRLIASGQAQLAAGRLAEAASFFEQARALAPDDPEVLHALGLVHWLAGEPSAADDLIATAMARDPAQATYHDHHGLVLAALGRTEAAEAAHRRALALLPRLAAAHNNLAALLHRNGGAPEALA